MNYFLFIVDYKVFFKIKMKFVALISGGKDSIFNIIKCIEKGHELILLINLYPASIND